MKWLLFLLALEFFVTNIISSDCTGECAAFAELLKNNMNTSVEPCEDFVEFACGRWVANNPIPDDEQLWTSFHTLYRELIKKVIGLLSAESNAVDTTGAFRKAKKMYENCMNLDAIEANGVTAIVSQLQKNGGWPAMMNSKDWKNSVPLSTILASYVRDLGSTALYDIDVSPDTENSTINRLNIDATFGTPFKVVLDVSERNSPKIAQYVDNIIEIVNILAMETGTHLNSEDVITNVNAMVDFESELAKIVPEIVALYDAKRRHNLMTINDFQLWYDSQSPKHNSKFRWLDIIQTVFNETNITSTPNDAVMIPEKDYIVELIKLLDATPIRTIVNYVHWCFVSGIIDAGPKKLRDISFKLAQIQTGVEKESERNKTCVQAVGLGHAIGHEYVKRYFSAATKQLALEVISNISNSASDLLGRTPWLTAEEKNIVDEKLSVMTRFIGYPDWYDKPLAVDKYYEKCVINNNYIENLIAMTRFETEILLLELPNPVDKTKFLLTPTDVNAYYSPYANSITFLAAVMQIPFFVQYSKALLYGTFGMVAGHEVSHAFDDYGAQFNKDGNREDWWSKETDDTFHSKVKCFVEQYNKYKVYETDNETLQINGDLTKGENIADLHGLKIAYQAYENSKTPEDVRFRLPGLESYNDRQLFFLAFSSIWCAAERPAFLNGVAKYDTHSIGKIRILGTLSNMKEFNDAFQCGTTDAMNPSNKCEIWGSSK